MRTGGRRFSDWDSYLESTRDRAHGHSIRAGVQVEPLDLPDTMPLLIHLSSLPVVEDLEGRVQTETVLDTTPERRPEAQRIFEQTPRRRCPSRST